MHYCYFVVEGQHDVAALGRLLNILDFKLIRKVKDVNAYWERIIPSGFPYRGDLLRRVPAPTFYQKEDYSIAILAAESDSLIIDSLDITLNNLDDATLINSVAIFCDADTKNANDRFKSLLLELAKKNSINRYASGLLTINNPGEVSTGNPKAGIYVFPDNVNPGVLDDMLLECASCCFPDILDPATKYVDTVDDRYKQKWKNTSRQKAIIGCVSNIFRPGKANQVSIQDNDWICQNSISNVEKMSKLHQFVISLLS